MIAEIPTISHRSTLEQAFKLLQQKSAPAVGVTDASGKLAGLVTSETIAEMMMLREASRRTCVSGHGAARPAPDGRSHKLVVLSFSHCQKTRPLSAVIGGGHFMSERSCAGSATTRRRFLTTLASASATAVDRGARFQPVVAATNNHTWRAIG